MRQQLRPTIEPLETKSLLSQFSPAGVDRHVGRGVPAMTRTIASRLEVGLKTNEVSYTPGQIVRMTFTETNKTEHDVVVAIGPSMETFSISHRGKTIWRSNPGVASNDIYLKNLKPGEAFTLTAAWTANSVTGKYLVHNQLAPRVGFTFEIVAHPASAARAERAE